MSLFQSSESGSSDLLSEKEESEEELSDEFQMTYIKPKTPQEQLLDEFKDNENQFESKLKEFQRRTNLDIVDVWETRNLKNHITLEVNNEEYLPGVFDLINLDESNVLRKIL